MPTILPRALTQCTHACHPKAVSMQTKRLRAFTVPVGAMKAVDKLAGHFIRWAAVTHSQHFQQHLQKFHAGGREIDYVVGRVAETGVSQAHTALRNVAGGHPYGWTG